MPEEKEELLPHLFRMEYAKMTAVLCRLFGLAYIEIAEDIVGDTFLKAMEVWVAHGIPENPTAWLYTVAKNKTRDYLKRHVHFQQIIKTQTHSQKFQADEAIIDFTEKNIGDSQLEMIFAVCNPVNSHEGQICLALQILCGFSMEEIANAFLTKPGTIKKRLLRARENLRNENFRLGTLTQTEISERLDTVLMVLYLLFNEGYFSKSHNQLIRKELCWEATRLVFILSKNKSTDTSEVNALLALMCFQSSRLDARADEHREAILFDEQDKKRWDQSLIAKGNYYFAKACADKAMSKYHIESAIACWHTLEYNPVKWGHILRLYDQLILSDHSSATALNRVFAIAKVYGNKTGLAEANKLNLLANHHWHSLLGFLYSNIDRDEAIRHYTLSISLSGSAIERKILQRQIERLINTPVLQKVTPSALFTNPPSDAEILFDGKDLD